jgi:methylated-DNA-[protein]-cysteine S-methyltransferase
LGEERLTSSQSSTTNQLQFQVDLGRIAVSWNSYGMLSRIEWMQPTDLILTDSEAKTAMNWAPGPILELVGRLKHYFECGQPLGSFPWEWTDQSNWTPFQYQVYSWIAKIPHGETRTYGWVASRIGRGSATRAVGQALKNNPLPIFIPCHRVVAVNSLGGFMGAIDPEQPEVAFKKKLLALEQSYLNPSFSFMNTLLAESAESSEEAEAFYAG